MWRRRRRFGCPRARCKRNIRIIMFIITYLHCIFVFFSNRVLSVGEHVWPVSVGVLVERSQVLESRLIAELVLFLRGRKKNISTKNG